MTASDMDNHDPQLNAVLDAIRAELARPPAEHIAQRHLTAMRATAPHSAGRRLWRNPMPVVTFRSSAVSAAVAMAFVLGLAAAGTLPDSAQNVVAETVSKVGLDLPDPDDERGGGHGKTGEADDSSEGDDSGEGGDADSTDKADNHGRTVSSVAHDDSLEGCEHGQAVSDVASSKSESSGTGSGTDADHDPCDHGGGDGSEPAESPSGNSGGGDQGNANSGGGNANSRSGGGDENDDDSTGSGKPDDDATSSTAGSSGGVTGRGNSGRGRGDDNPSDDNPGADRTERGGDAED